MRADIVFVELLLIALGPVNVFLLTYTRGREECGVLNLKNACHLVPHINCRFSLFIFAVNSARLHCYVFCLYFHDNAYGPLTISPFQGTSKCILFFFGIFFITLANQALRNERTQYPSD